MWGEKTSEGTPVFKEPGTFQSPLIPEKGFNQFPLRIYFKDGYLGLIKTCCEKKKFLHPNI